MDFKRACLFLILFMLFASQLPLAQEGGEVERLIDRGIEYERVNRLDDAIEVYRQVLALDPANVLIRVRLAKVLSWKEKYEEALIILDGVLRENPSRAEALFRKAQILSWQGRYDESIKFYEAYLAIKPDDADALMGIARLNFWRKNYQAAIDYFNEAVRFGANEVEARIELAKVYIATEDKKMARNELVNVLELDPDNAEAKRLLRGLSVEKTWELAPLNLRWNVYPDRSYSLATSMDLTYHMRQSWDFILTYEHDTIGSLHDQTLGFTGVFRKLKGLYVRGGAEVTPDPHYSPEFGSELGFSFGFAGSFMAGLTGFADFYDDETLITITPELAKNFTDISYIGIKYNYYRYTTGYSTSTVEFILNIEYFPPNDFFIKAIYGGDSEVKNTSRRVFDLSAGISYHITEYYEIEASYGIRETPTGRTHEIAYRSVVKW